MNRKSELYGTAQVWFFERPIIGYCRKCQCTADWMAEEGLYCPICKTDELSIFEYNHEGPWPE